MASYVFEVAIFIGPNAFRIRIANARETIRLSACCDICLSVCLSHTSHNFRSLNIVTPQFVFYGEVNPYTIVNGDRSVKYF